MKRLLILVAVIFSLGCSQQKNVAGCYRSNFPAMGFFGTHLHLNKDSTFDYRFAGDLVNDVGHGRYTLKEDTVVLIMLRKKPETFDDSLITSRYSKDTLRFYFHHHKLFVVNTYTHKVVKYEHGHSKHKRYLLFGSKYHIMRYYLKPHPCEIWKN